MCTLCIPKQSQRLWNSVMSQCFLNGSQFFLPWGSRAAGKHRMTRWMTRFDSSRLTATHARGASLRVGETVSRSLGVCSCVTKSQHMEISFRNRLDFQWGEGSKSMWPPCLEGTSTLNDLPDVRAVTDCTRIRIACMRGIIHNTLESRTPFRLPRSVLSLKFHDSMVKKNHL